MTYLNDEEVCLLHARYDTFERAIPALRTVIRLEKESGKWGTRPPPGIFQCPLTYGMKTPHFHVGKKSQKGQEQLDVYRSSLHRRFKHG